MDDRVRPSAPAARASDVWPAELIDVFGRAVTAEFATLTRDGRPVTVPTTPYVALGERTLDVSTGLTYPAKAERARRDPRVCLLFADPIGPSQHESTVVLVQGLASVRDTDLQANTDRYVDESMAKLPEATKGAPRASLRRMAWYFARIWIEITPLHMRWWESRALARHLGTWDAPDGTAAPLSDPPPGGKQPSPWLDPPGSWQHVARSALGKLGLHDLSVVDANGFPLCVPVTQTELTGDGFRLVVGKAAPNIDAGPACLTMHTHPDAFTGQENRTFVGTIEEAGNDGSLSFRAERALADWSIAGALPRRALGFLLKGRRLSRRLEAEARRRSQPVPTVRLPGDR